jgi:Protein of unknown function (DUF3684)
MVSTGFYSLFSVTDEPHVTSGGTPHHSHEPTTVLLFHTRTMDELLLEGQEGSGQSCLYIVVSTILPHLQLFVRRGTIPVWFDPWTTFQMTLREPGPIPPAFDLTRFLVSSITFMTHLSEVSVYFDDKRLVILSKDSGMSKEVPMLRGLRTTSPEGMMEVKSIETMREFRCDFGGKLSVALP